MVVVSIIGTDKSAGGYGAAKLAQERAALALAVRADPAGGPVLRVRGGADGLGRQGEVFYLPPMRTQIVAARTVAEALVDIARSRRRRGRRPPKSPARARNTSRTWPSWSPPGAATR